MLTNKEDEKCNYCETCFYRYQYLLLKRETIVERTTDLHEEWKEINKEIELIERIRNAK